MSHLSLPNDPGVYLFLDKEGGVVYVGKANDLRSRVASYFAKGSVLAQKTKLMVSKVAKIRYVTVESEFESLLLEAAYVQKFKPFFNTRLTDDKSYPQVQITIKDTYPSILIARRSQDAYSLYFGPYPNVSAMRLVLRTIRKVFPYQSVRNHPKRICLFHHLGLCPCPPVFDSKQLQVDYRKTIRHIVSILEGNIKKVASALEEERDRASMQEDFEKAKDMQKRIDAIKLVTSRARKPFEYDVNPNLLSDLRKQELNELSTILQENDVPVSSLSRIECFDISNTAGTNSTGSMIVFASGEKNSSEYRRFRISKHIAGPNDFAMMEEVIRRRFKHSEWPYPDLLIVDGGKGQVSSALKAMKNSGVYIPAIGLAKREEIIVTQSFKEVRLHKASKALFLLMRIRNEAHRFAIAYHRKLRSKLSLAQ